MANIILVGLPSCGKSTVGVLLAKNLGYRFMDSDLIIQEQTGKLLHELIEEHGVSGFLKSENEINSSIQTDRAVISTGGSAVYGEDAMAHFKQNGLVVYLKIDFETLTERLGDYVHRGVALPAGYTLRNMYDERIKLYERYADVTVEESLITGLGDTVARVTDLCKARLQER